MKKRMLGNTGIEVSEVGFGAWQLGNENDWGKMSDDEAIRLVHEAIINGCFFFDTAPNYGLGKSEELLGKALKGRRDEVVISTKCGHQADNQQTFEPDAIATSVEDSLKRLNTDYLDSLLLHNPPLTALNQESPQFQVLEKLKNQGKIRAYGASVDSGKEVNQILDRTDSQIIEIMFSIFHQEPLDAMSRAYNEGVGLIVKVPLDSGWLTGKYDKNSTFEGVRSRWSKEDIQRRGELVEKVREIIGEETSMVRAALQYILSYKEVGTVIPGARDSKQLLENLSASQDIMSEELVQDLRGLWIEELKGRPLPW